jgi:hypothetical protein
MIDKGIVQGPNLAVAVIAASRLGVKLNPVVALPLLRHAEPSVRAATCACARPGGDIVATLIDLLADLNGEAATAAACALGIMGRVEARDLLKRCLIEKPSPRVIEALAGVADEEAIVFLARLGRKRPELANSVLSALDEIDHARATVAASGLKSWLSHSDRRDVAIRWSAIRRPRGLAPSNAPRSTYLDRAPFERAAGAGDCGSFWVVRLR